jgi:hypothetical protein
MRSFSATGSWWNGAGLGEIVSVRSFGMTLCRDREPPDISGCTLGLRVRAVRMPLRTAMP